MAHQGHFALSAGARGRAPHGPGRARYSSGMDFTQIYDRYAALAEAAVEPAITLVRQRDPDWFDPVGEDGEVLEESPEELADGVRRAIRIALEELTTCVSFTQLHAEGEARQVLIADLAQDASRLFPHYWLEKRAPYQWLPSGPLREAIAKATASMLAPLGEGAGVAVVRVAREVQRAVFDEDRALDWENATPEQRAQIVDEHLSPVLEQLQWQWGSAAKHSGREEGYFVYIDARPADEHRPPPAHPGTRSATRARPKRVKRPKSHGKRKR